MAKQCKQIGCEKRRKESERERLRQKQGDDNKRPSIIKNEKQ